eukprot:788003-Rhodomonas_salina.1
MGTCGERFVSEHAQGFFQFSCVVTHTFGIVPASCSDHSFLAFVPAGSARAISRIRFWCDVEMKMTENACNIAIKKLHRDWFAFFVGDFCLSIMVILGKFVGLWESWLDPAHNSRFRIGWYDA